MELLTVNSILRETQTDGEIIERKIRSNYNYYNCSIMEWKINEFLDNRPRYTKRIPKKTFLKFYEIEVHQGEPTIRKENSNRVITADGSVNFRFRFKNLFK